MTKKLETIVFFGSGPVAAQALEKLYLNFNIEAVITKPQPSHHIYEMPVLEVTKRLSLKTFTPSNKVELSELFSKKPIKSTLGVVLDYGIIIPKDVIDYFPLGIVNSHFSLLPKLRGADPISFAILNGENNTGVSLMLIDEKMDEGPLIAQEKYPLNNSITTPLLIKDLINLSDKMLKQYLPLYFEGKIKLKVQIGEPTYSRKLTKEDSVLDFNKTAEVLCREVRAYLEWPRSRTQIKGINIIITKSHEIIGTGKIGNIYIKDKTLGIYTSKNIFMIDNLIPNGKKEMSVEAFLAGYKIIN